MFQPFPITFAQVPFSKLKSTQTSNTTTLWDPRLCHEYRYCEVKYI